MSNPRPAGMHVVAYQVDQDGVTGRWGYWVRVEVWDDQGNVMFGPPEKHEIGLDELNSAHGGSHQKFLTDHVKPRMLSRHQALTASHDEARSMVGKSL